MIHLILGGARSGKSVFAEKCVLSSTLDTQKERFYLATSQSFDDEMAQRIQLHKDRRDDVWNIIEEPVELARCLLKYDDEQHVILIDCLTLWLSNCLFHEGGSQLIKQKQALLELLPKLKADVYVVSNEVGQGVIPLGQGNRLFVDESGLLHQDMAKLADRVSFVTAGIAQQLKFDN